MKPYVWTPETSLEDSKNGAYWERNMLALMLATVVHNPAGNVISGWYYDTDNNWEGWKRVISIHNGQYGFHIPDDFDIGTLRQISANWDGHTTEEKWVRMMTECGIDLPWVEGPLKVELCGGPNLELPEPKNPLNDSIVKTSKVLDGITVNSYRYVHPPKSVIPD